MSSIFFDITFKKNKTCSSGEQFIKNYFKHSYYHLTYFKPEFKVRSFNNTIFNDQLIEAGIAWHFSNLNFIVNLVKLAITINRQDKPIVFLHGFNSPLHVLVFKFFLKANTTVIVQHHAEKPFRNNLKRLAQKLAYRNFSAYFFSTKALAAQYLEKGIITTAVKVHEVMEGSTLFRTKDKQHCRELLQLKEKNIFIWVGRLDSNKDPLTVLKAIHLYQESSAVFKLYMVFHSSELEKEVTDFIASHHLSNYVTLVGEIPHEHLETWFNAADYFLAASHYEGSGYALCEAMACGCVPVVTKIPSFIKMTNYGHSGILFEPGSPDDLFKKLSALNEADTALMRQRVIEQFNHELSFMAISEKIKEIINRLAHQ